MASAACGSILVLGYVGMVSCDAGPVACVGETSGTGGAVGNG